MEYQTIQWRAAETIRIDAYQLQAQKLVQAGQKGFVKIPAGTPFYTATRCHRYSLAGGSGTLEVVCVLNAISGLMGTFLDVELLLERAQSDQELIRMPGLIL
jgi:hypothetical protein